MDTSDVSLKLIILFLLLAASALFSASETALMSVSKVKIKNLANNGNKKALNVEKILENPDDFISTILVMNNLVNITASSFSTVVMYNIFGNIGASLATGVITVLVLIFGEITPKNLAVQNSEKVAMAVSGMIAFLIKVLKPVTFIFKKISNFICKLTNSEGIDNSVITEDELKILVDASEENGVLNSSEKEMLFNVFDFDSIYVKDVMVTKPNIVALNINSTYEETICFLSEDKYSRIPVYKESLDNIVGIFCVKDLIFNRIDENNFDLSKHIRTATQTYELKKIHDLFKDMKKTKSHMYIVLDEYGATKGIITMEDMVEEIFGDIVDEFDTIEDTCIIDFDNDRYEVSGSARMDEISKYLNLNIDTDNEEYDSVGGFFIKKYGGFPKISDNITFDNYKFTIADMYKKQIKKIEIEYVGS